MTFSNEDDRPQLRARCSRELHDKVTQLAEKKDTTLSEEIRNAVRGYVPSDDDDTQPMPEDPELETVYRWLRDRADDQGYVPSQPALSGLAQKLSIKEEFVKNARLKPLERGGWIQPSYSHIRVLDGD